MVMGILKQRRAVLYTWSCRKDGIGIIHQGANTLSLAGDAELLETITAYPEILSSRGESNCEVARQLHEWVSGGMIKLNG